MIENKEEKQETEAKLINTAAEMDGYEGGTLQSSFGAGSGVNKATMGKWGRGSVAPLNITNTAALVAKFNWPTSGGGEWGNVRSNNRRHAGIDLHHWAGQVPNAPVQSFTSGKVYQTSYPIY